MSLPEQQRRDLVALAFESIRHGLRHGRPLPVDLDRWPTELKDKLATFVTLEKAGNLRGCIGSLQASQPLVVDVARNAFYAAFEDPRFPSVREDEIDQLELHISILSAPEILACSSEQELLQKMRPGIDGLIIEEGVRRATFLPSVWEQLPKPPDFVRHLKMKAGLPFDYWSPTLKTFRYTAELIP